MIRSALDLRFVLLATLGLTLAACTSAPPANPSPTTPPTTATAPGAAAPTSPATAVPASGATPLTATDTGVTKDSILLGGTAPLSGPAAAYGALAKASDAYFHYVNDNGGVNGRQITYKYLDDAYNPAQTVPLAKQLVEQDHIFLFYFGSGTQTQTSVRDYLNSKKVPQIFTATGATTFSAEFEKYPYTTGWQPSYQGESLITPSTYSRTRRQPGSA